MNSSGINYLRSNIPNPNPNSTSAHDQSVSSGANELQYFSATVMSSPSIINSAAPVPIIAANNNNDILPLLRNGLIKQAEKNCYIVRLFVQNPVQDKGLHISESYVNLAIINNPDDKEKNQPRNTDEAYQNEREQKYKNLYATKTPVELETLFDNSEHKRQLIIGVPGIGKTTLCQHLFYRCVQDHGLGSDKFVAVFWIPLRNLKDVKAIQNNINLLAYIVRHHILFGPEQYKIGESKLQGFIAENSTKILWLLDGYDEVITEAELIMLEEGGTTVALKYCGSLASSLVN